ncbi:hypothetical protein ACP4J4_01645 [Aureimonas ureilytica]|uniref:hypothetical protein n=1 Tax=Aureimonas ureilytica TaxID=401562 RepID=UPI003CF26C9D
MTTFPEELAEEVNEEPAALVAEVVADTTLTIEGEVVVPVGSKPAIFISVRVVFLTSNMQEANEAVLFGEL